MIDNPIGRKVYQLVPFGNYSWKLDKEHTYEVVKVIGYEDAKDWCRHYVIKGEDGEEKKIREIECVFCPDTTKPLDYMLYGYLKDNGVYADVYTNGVGGVQVHIDWGDWKHDHGWCDDLMGYLGWSEGDCIVTEENGSDCYSADHYYYKMEVSEED